MDLVCIVAASVIVLIMRLVGDISTDTIAICTVIMLCAEYISFSLKKEQRK